MKTKTASLTETGSFQIVERDISPASDEVMVRVAACGLCNWELNHFEGRKGKLPMTLGHEWAGVVVGKGEKAGRFEIGDKVAYFPGGADARLEGFSQYVCAKEQYCYKLNQDVDVRYAICEPLKCISTVLRAAGPEAGDFGIVIGCGPMGLWCVQGLAGKLLAGLIAIDVDDRKLEYAARYGATATINSARENVVEKLKKITGGHMADFIIEGTGVTEVLNDAQEYLRMKRGRLVVMSSYKGPAAGFDFRRLGVRGGEIISGMPMASADPADDMRRAVELLNRGTFRVKDMVTHVFGLEEIQQAFETLKNKPEGYLKGIVLMEN
ncbi:MAG: zinc-binding dehydrogenase [Eubacteriales bacterium]|nr:zinc-binding dehydrogenase [Eubacteriales bacterium]